METKTGRELKVALVGCGQIADAHLQEIRKISCARLVGICDRHVDLARQAGARFEVAGVYDEVGRMLDAERPDVLHITTPPQTHASIALGALSAGVHVYVEKPFTVDVEECDRVLEGARQARRLVCVGHDQLFDPVWEECRQMHRGGELGRVVHVDSVQGYDLSGPFGKAFAGDGGHWVHRLPGGLFQNVMSHAMYRITEFMGDEQPRVWAHWFGGGAPTELRVMMRGEQVTANLIFSSLVRPVQRVVRVYGTRKCVEVDLDGRTLRVSRALSAPGAFAKIEAPWRQVMEAAGRLRRNLVAFARGRIQYFGGLNRLCELFYQAILDGKPSPIGPGEIRRVTAIMEEIFCRCRMELDEREDGDAGRRMIRPGVVVG